jgi:hypothetical protein
MNEGCPEALVRDVIDRRRAGREAGDSPAVRVNSHNVEAGLYEGDREREADVTEADDPDASVDLVRSCHPMSLLCSVVQDSGDRGSELTSDRR